MQSLSHQNIVRYLGAEVDEDAGLLYIFQEWIPGGSIANLLDKFGPFSNSVVRKYLLQLLRGLDYLHTNGIVHRDIKGGNILVDDRGEVKLADFGASRSIENSGTMISSMKGTPYFMAPEVYEERYDGRKADIWSFGGVALQMISGEPPWKSCSFKNPMMLFLHIKESNKPPTMPKHISDSLKELITVCFNRDPVKRPSTGQLFDYEFFQQEDSDDDSSCTSDSSLTPTNSHENSLIPSTPKVDVRSASKRALLKSEERRRRVSKSVFQGNFRKEDFLTEFKANQHLSSTISDGEFHAIKPYSNIVVPEEEALEDMVSPLSDSGVQSNEDWPSWAKQDMSKLEKKKASNQFFPPIPLTKECVSEEIVESIDTKKSFLPLIFQEPFDHINNSKIHQTKDERGDRTSTNTIPICKIDDNKDNQDHSLSDLNEEASYSPPMTRSRQRGDLKVKRDNSSIKLPPIRKNTLNSRSVTATPVASNTSRRSRVFDQSD